MNSPASAPANAHAPHRSLLARLQPHQPLAIDALPGALAALGAGQVHVVYAQGSPARDALFWQTAADALAGPATVLSTRDAHGVAVMLREHGIDIDQAGALHAHANVCTLRTLPGRPGADVLMEALQALADQCAEPASQFLVEGAEAFFSWHDANALALEGARLATWCAQRRYGVLLVLAPPDLADDTAHPELNAFQARFAGVAQLLQVSGQYRWEVAFWRDRDAMLASQSLPLRFTAPDFRLTVSDTSTFDAASDTGGLLAPDEDRVLVAREAVLRERVLPERWQVLDSNDAVVDAARTAVAATVILDFGASQQLELLAAQVHALRLGCGPALKIIVREDRVAMRYESLMLNLGANQVIHRNTPIAQVEAIVERLQGQVFSRPVPADYRAALAAVSHSTETGYVPGARFVELVRAAVSRSRVIQLPSVLLRFALLPEVAHVDALKACELRREGDLVTAVGDSVYVFLFACRLGDADAICQRVFTTPLADLFNGELRSGDQQSITETLDTLTDEIEATTPPDYSGWLAKRPPRAVPDAVVADADMDTPTSTQADTPPPSLLPALDAAASRSVGAAPIARAEPQRASLPLKPVPRAEDLSP